MRNPSPLASGVVAISDIPCPVEAPPHLLVSVSKSPFVEGHQLDWTRAHSDDLILTQLGL